METLAFSCGTVIRYSGMITYRTAIIGCSRMGAFIDNEVGDLAAVMRPFSHAAGYRACPRTRIVACSDVREEVMVRFGEEYDVPGEKRYSDYRDMIKRESPDIVSVATQPEQRAEIVIHAANYGVKAIYAEKALAASLEEADAMRNAIEGNGTVFNMGTNRRWEVGYLELKALIESGKYGALESFIIYGNGTLFNTASHTLDLMLTMAGDVAPEWVQATLREGDNKLYRDGDLAIDPVGEGIVQFPGGVRGYALHTARRVDFEAICESGTVTARNNGQKWEVYERHSVAGARYPIYRPGSFPEFERRSSTLTLIEDIVRALDSGRPTRGGIRVACINLEIIFAFIESHRLGGARVALPLETRDLKLNRKFAPKQPIFEA